MPVEADTLFSVDSRRRVYACITEHPGAHLRDIARRCGLPLGTTLYHLDCLEARSRVATRRDGRYKRYFLAHGLGRRERDLLSLLRHDAPRRISLALLTDGPLTQRELHERLGLSRSTVSFHLGRLVAEGVVERHPTRPEHRYEMLEREPVRDLLLRFRSSLQPAPDASDGRRFHALAHGAAPNTAAAPAGRGLA